MIREELPTLTGAKLPPTAATWQVTRADRLMADSRKGE